MTNVRHHLERVFLRLTATWATIPLALCLGNPSLSYPCDADSVLSSFEQSLPSGQVTKVKYHKEARSLLFGERTPEDGVLWLGPPKRYRLESKNQVVVRGLDTLWAYTPQTKQVTLRVGNLDSLEFGPAGFFGSLRNDFFAVDCAADTVNKQAMWRVRLAAKTETAAIQRLSLWIDPATHRVHTAEYVDYNEETARLTFSNYEIESHSPGDRFNFICPKGVERIVLPASKASQTNNDHQ